MKTNTLKKALLYFLVSILTLTVALESVCLFSKLYQTDTIDLCVDDEPCSEESDNEDKSELKSKMPFINKHDYHHISLFKFRISKSLRVQNENICDLMVPIPIPFTPPDLS